MPEVQKMIQICERLIKTLSFYKKENKRLEASVDNLRRENQKLRDENLRLNSHQQFPR